MAERWWEVIH